MTQRRFVGKHNLADFLLAIVVVALAVASAACSGVTAAPQNSNSPNSPSNPGSGSLSISAVASSGISATGATITWTTSGAASSQVNYGTTASYGQSSTLSSSLVTSHSVTLSNLTASTTYHFQVVSVDGNGNNATGADSTFTTPSGVTLPTIAGVSAASVLANSAGIVWTTNTSTTSEVDYGTTTSYGQKVTSTTLVTAHLQTVAGLTPSTLYHFRVQSVDASGNVATSGDSTFTTTLPIQTGCPSTTAIGNLGCSLAAGSWVQVPNSAMSGWSSGNVLRPPSGGSITEFSDKAQWNPINNTFMFLGGSHVTNKANCDATLFVSYTDSTNTWSNTNLNSPCPNDIGGFGGFQNLGHAYQDDTIDPATGNYFYREYGSVSAFMYSQASQSWSQLPKFESSCASGSSCTEGGLEWFPDRNSLVLVDGTAGIFECVFSGSNSNGTPCASWTQLACTAFTCSGIPRYNQMGPYQNMAIYSPLCKCIIAGGGGSTFMVAYQSNGTFRSLGATPFTLDTADSQGGNAWVRDPISGRFVVLDVTCDLWTYDPEGDVWTNTGGQAPQCPTAENGVANIVTAPVSVYGIMMFVYQGSAGGNGSVYLYRGK